MATTAQRLRSLRERRLGWSMARMAQLLGFSHASGYQRYELESSYRRHRFIKADVVHKLAKAIVGKGRPPISADEVYALGGLKNLHCVESAATVHDDTGVLIPVLDARADSAGVLAAAENDGAGGPESWRLPCSYLDEIARHPPGLRLIRVLGDSMTRADGSGIRSGDVVMADLKDRHPAPAGVFALDEGFGVVVKRLEFAGGSEPPRVRISCDNPAHAAYERAAAEIRIIGRCVWQGQRL